MLALFESDDVAVRQYVARLYNALSSLQKGKLSGSGRAIRVCYKFVPRNMNYEFTNFGQIR